MKQQQWKYGVIYAILSGLAIANFSMPTHAAPVQKLPAVGAVLEKTSVSGLSSGAFMTSQFYIAYSSIMVGAGIVAGGPYLCAQSWIGSNFMMNAMTTCMNPLIPSVGPNTPVLLEKTRALAQEKKIDALENLKNDSLYVFSGKSDHVVATSVVEQTVRFFEEVGVPKTSIVFDTNIDAGHAISTQDGTDITCALTKSPFINNCGFEQSWRILNQIFKTLKAPVPAESSSLVAFDQTEFIDSANTSMSDVAYAYIPETCRKEKGCAVHVAFHGCLQGAEEIQDKFYAKTGYNDIAQSNRMIILYPQVKKSFSQPLNPQGCWDFWGYSSPDNPNPDYYTKQAPQLRAVYKMVQRLAGN